MSKENFTAKQITLIMEQDKEARFYGKEVSVHNGVFDSFRRSVYVNLNPFSGEASIKGSSFEFDAESIAHQQFAKEFKECSKFVSKFNKGE